MVNSGPGGAPRKMNFLASVMIGRPTHLKAMPGTLSKQSVESHVFRQSLGNGHPVRTRVGRSALRSRRSPLRGSGGNRTPLTRRIAEPLMGSGA